MASGLADWKDLLVLGLYFAFVLVVGIMVGIALTLNAPIATKVVCFSRLLKCLRSLYGKSVDPDQSVLGPRCLFLYLIRQ